MRARFVGTNPRGETMRTILRALAFSAIVLTLFVPLAPTASAAEPANQACLGHDLSGYAQGGAAFGGFISGLATATQGVGTEFQLHQSGGIPDTVIPNTCND
jgi:hypothetical protein